MSIMPAVDLLAKPTTLQRLQSLDAPLFTGEGLIISLLLLAPVLLRAVLRRAHRAAGSDIESKAV